MRPLLVKNWGMAGSNGQKWGQEVPESARLGVRHGGSGGGGQNCRLGHSRQNLEVRPKTAATTSRHLVTR